MRTRPNYLSTRAILIQLAGAAMLLTALHASATSVNVDTGDGVVFDNFSLVRSLNIPANDNRILIVGFGSITENYIDVSLTSLTYNGVPLTRLGGVVQNAFTDWWSRTDIYYLINPPAGFGSLSGTVNGARPTGFRQESVWGMYGMALSGAAQTAPRLAFTNQQNPGAPSPTIGGSVTTLESDSMLVGFTALNAGFNHLFSTSGVTENYDVAINEISFGAGHKAVSGDPELFTWTTAGYATGIGTVAIAEVAAAAVPAPLPLVLLASALAGLIVTSRRQAIG